MKIPKIIFLFLIYSTQLFSQGNNSSLDKDFLIGIKESAINNSIENQNPNTVSKHHLFFPNSFKGKCITKNEGILEDSNYSFNYDINEKSVLVTSSDNKVINSISLSALNAVLFITNEGDRWFETNDNILKNELFQILVKMPAKYILYKYIDYLHIPETVTYYIVSPDNKVSKTTLNRKSINSILENNPKSVYFINYHKRGKIDENYLKDFISYLNYF